MNVVKIENLSKTFDSHVAVDNLSLEVPKGSIYGFIGPNGSGKTTTMRMLMNIIQPDSGSIEIFGETLRGSSTDRIGYLPEERGLYRNMTVRDLLNFYGSLKNGAGIRKKVNLWLEKMDLLEWSGKKIRTLSKGMSLSLIHI